jgi:hypothetical protein
MQEQSTEAAEMFIKQLYWRFPSQRFLDALGILDPAFYVQDPGENEMRKHLSVLIDQFCEPKVADAGDGNQPQAVKAMFDANALQEQGSRFYGMALLAAVRMQFSRMPPAVDSDDEQEDESGRDTEDDKGSW